MRYLKICLLITAITLALGSTVFAQAQISWAGYTWETQPWQADYEFTAGSTYVDDDTGWLFQRASTAAGKRDWLFPGLSPYGWERYAVAQMVTGGTQFSEVIAKVYENSATAQGPSLYIKSSTGMILSVGMRPAYNTNNYSYYMINMWDGASWYNNNWITRGKTNYSNYLDFKYTLNAEGKIDVRIDYASSPAYSYNGTYNWTTPVVFGDISEVWLVQAVSTNLVDGPSKWRQFSATPVPEPASVIALATGLAGMAGFAIRRRR